MAEHDSTKVDLDLDTLTKEHKTIRIQGKIIKIYPVELGDLFRLSKLAGSLKVSDDTDTMEGVEQASEAFDKLKGAFVEIVPDLKEVKVNIDQLFALLDVIVEMAMPSDVAELEKRGIKLTDAQKKILSASLKKSGDSSTTTPDTPSN